MKKLSDITPEMIEERRIEVVEEMNKIIEEGEEIEESEKNI